MNPLHWLVTNWHWAYLLLVIVLVMVFGVLVVVGDWFD